MKDARNRKETSSIIRCSRRGALRTDPSLRRSPARAAEAVKMSHGGSGANPPQTRASSAKRSAQQMPPQRERRGANEWYHPRTESSATPTARHAGQRGVSAPAPPRGSGGDQPPLPSLRKHAIGLNRRPGARLADSAVSVRSPSDSTVSVCSPGRHDRGNVGHVGVITIYSDWESDGASESSASSSRGGKCSATTSFLSAT